MDLITTLKQHSAETGSGINIAIVRDLEARLNIQLPDDFKTYLTTLNYAELFDDPIYGIHPDNSMLDLYSQNKHKEHFRYGFIEIFSSDIDGTIYLRPDSGAIYNASFTQPVAVSFTAFVQQVLSEA